MTSINPSFVALWQELRQRLLLWLLVLIIFSVALLPLASHLFTVFARPLLHTLNPSQPLIATGIISGFWIPIELSLWFALLLSIPILLWQCWAFAKPALKKTEKKWWKIYLAGSFFLFLAGLFFCYQVVLPLCMRVLIRATPESVHIMPDIVNYLNFSFRLLLTFGLAFQLPLLILLVSQFKFVSIDQLQKNRRYIIIGAFVIGMIIAPDVITQCFLAIPLWLLYELGILLVKFFIPSENP
ncbi:MAG: twin-arginine protein translocation system subunit TatC [Gammaproteobacteria bacterium]|jgi:sec-independent protein translocase protein TatC|nr:twin-arginine protein translocation system subunit TatC [Gammaproteobacteria bacterium]